MSIFSKKLYTMELLRVVVDSLLKMLITRIHPYVKMTSKQRAVLIEKAVTTAFSIKKQFVYQLLIINKNYSLLSTFSIASCRLTAASKLKIEEIYSCCKCSK